MLRKSRSLYKGYHSLRLLRQGGNRNLYWHHAEELIGNPGDDLEQLSQLALHPPVFWERELLSINEQYAHDLVIKKFLGLDPGTRLDVIIEHGLVLNRSLVENHLANPFARQNIVMSQARVDYLAANQIQATAIGPYLHYATPLFDAARVGQLKKRLGKTLLFFPSHSTQDVCVEGSYRDLQAMMTDLKARHRFDSVLVCGYYLDIENGLFDHLEKGEGYHFISCGHRQGPLFLQLLKSWLQLADVAAANSLGTQAGYALFCGKPFWVVGSHDITKFYGGDKESVEAERLATAQPLIGKRKLSFEQLEAMFRDESYVVDPDLMECVAELWGFHDLLGADELYRAVFGKDRER